MYPPESPKPTVVPHPKLKRDYTGQTVRTTVELSNSWGWGPLPKGSIAHIYRQSRTGSELWFHPCKRCGLQATVKRVGAGEIEFLAGSIDKGLPELWSRPEENPNVVDAPKLKRDYVGKRVRTLCDLQNGYGIIPRGAIATIDHQSPKGSSLEFERCGYCGQEASITHVSHTKIEFIDWNDQE